MESTSQANYNAKLEAADRIQRAMREGMIAVPSVSLGGLPVVI